MKAVLLDFCHSEANLSYCNFKPMQGRFEIICLSGSYLVTDNGGPRGRTGGLSVLLASPDGRVIGGGVGGVLLAASPVQVTFCSLHTFYYFVLLIHCFPFCSLLKKLWIFAASLQMCHST